MAFDPTLDRNKFLLESFGCQPEDRDNLLQSLEAWQDTTVTSAQILALFTTPITLVAAPGAGLALVVTRVFSSITYNSAAYAFNAAGLLVQYTGAAGASVGATLTQAYLQSSANAAQSVIAAATALTPVVNSPIVAFAGTANPTTGNSAIKIRVYYKVVPMPLP